MLAASDDLMAMYDALQNFHAIYRLNSYNLQRAELTTWTNSALSSNVAELKSAANTIKHWRKYILNSWKYDKSNGPCEGLNNKIKAIKRISFGIHDFEMFRRRILMICGYTHLNPDTDYSINGLLGRSNSHNSAAKEDN